MGFVAEENHIWGGKSLYHSPPKTAPFLLPDLAEREKEENRIMKTKTIFWFHSFQIRLLSAGQTCAELCSSSLRIEAKAQAALGPKCVITQRDPLTAILDGASELCL